MQRNLFGMYRGVVVSIADSDQRQRVRVRVHGVHAPDAAADACPQAEVCRPTGRARGVFFRYAVGEIVWVMFEGGNPLLPVVMGGQVATAGQIPDVPVSQQVRDKDGADLFVIEDDAGNSVEFDATSRKKGVTIRSGGAAVKISGSSEMVTVEAMSGAVRVHGPTVSVDARTANITASTVNIDGTSKSPLNVDNGKVRIGSNDRVSIDVAPTIPAASNASAIGGKINEGGGNPTLMGIPVPVALPTQANVHNMRSRFINVGVGPTGFVAGLGGTDPLISPGVDYEPTIAEAAAGMALGLGPSYPKPLLPTLEINIRSAMSVNVAAPFVNVGGSASVTVTSQALMTIRSFGLLSVQALAQASITALGNVDITAPVFTLTAPIINLTGVVNVIGPLNVEGTVTCPAMIGGGVPYLAHKHAFADNTAGGPVPNTTAPPT